MDGAIPSQSHERLHRIKHAMTILWKSEGAHQKSISIPDIFFGETGENNK
jgi:hypothetical protein